MAQSGTFTAKRKSIYNPLTIGSNSNAIRSGTTFIRIAFFVFASYVLWAQKHQTWNQACPLQMRAVRPNKSALFVPMRESLMCTVCMDKLPHA